MRTLKNTAGIAFSAVMMLLLSGCDKKETDVEEEKKETPEEVIKVSISGSYLIKKVESRSSGQRSDITSTWFSSYAGECSKDDLTIFKPDESFVVLDGTIECSESTDDNGTWSVIDDTSMKIDRDTAQIEILDKTTLRIVSPVYSSAQSDIIFTYVRE